MPIYLGENKVISARKNDEAIADGSIYVGSEQILVSGDLLVTNAGKQDANGTYCRNGNYNNVSLFQKGDTNNKIWKDNNSSWHIGELSENTDISFYSVTSNTKNPPLAGWATDTYGNNPVPNIFRTQCD